MAVILNHSRKIDILCPLNRSYDGSDRFELTFSAVNKDYIGILESVFLVVRKAPFQRFFHRPVVILALDFLHLEQSVGLPVCPAVFEHDHSGADIIITEIGDIERFSSRDRTLRRTQKLFKIP